MSYRVTYSYEHKPQAPIQVNLTLPARRFRRVVSRSSRERAEAFMQTQARGQILAVWATIDESGKAEVEIQVKAPIGADPYFHGYATVHRLEYQLPEADNP